MLHGPLCSTNFKYRTTDSFILAPPHRQLQMGIWVEMVTSVSDQRWSTGFDPGWGKDWEGVMESVDVWRKTKDIQLPTALRLLPHMRLELYESAKQLHVLMIHEMWLKARGWSSRWTLT